MSILSSILSTSTYIYIYTQQTNSHRHTDTHNTPILYIHSDRHLFFPLLHASWILFFCLSKRVTYDTIPPPQLQLHTYAHIPRPFFIFSFPCSLSFFRSALLYDDSEGLIHTELYSIHDTCCWRWIYILFYFVLFFLTLVWCSEEGKSYYYD